MDVPAIPSPDTAENTDLLHIYDRLHNARLRVHSAPLYSQFLPIQQGISSGVIAFNIAMRAAHWRHRDILEYLSFISSRRTILTWR